MSVVVRRPGQSVTLTGRLIAATVGEVREVLQTAVDAGQGDLQVECSGVPMVDATGLGVLVGAHRRAEAAGRRLVLVGVPPRIDGLLLATRLHRVLNVDRGRSVA